MGCAIFWCSLATACAGRLHVLPAHLVVHRTPELLERMRAVQSTVPAYAADINLSYRGPQGRARGDAAIIVARPSQLRYAVYGPHGGVLSAFAMNDQRVYSMDLQAMQYAEGSASPANIDVLLPFAPLGFSAAQWTDLLFGVVAIPEHAALHYDNVSGYFVVQWDAPSLTSPSLQIRRTMHVEVDPYTARVALVQCTDNGHTVARVQIRGWTENGLPKEFEIDVIQPKIHLGADFHHHNVTIQPSAHQFVLRPAPGMEIQELP